MSGSYAEFVENEVLPLVEAKAHVKLTKDPEGRATMGGSSGGACALIMAWYHPELYHRVLAYSGTLRQPAMAARIRRRRTAPGNFMNTSSREPAQADPTSGWKSATRISSIPTSCATTCTTGS